MKKIIYFLIGVIFIYFLMNFHSEDEKYKVLNEISKDCKLNLDYVKEEKEIVTFKNGMFNEFSIFEKPSVFFQFISQNFIGNQFPKSEINKFKANKIVYFNNHNKKIEFSKITNECYSETQNNFKEKIENGKKIIILPPLCNGISLPILSFDSETALLKINSSVGTNYTVSYKKINGKWKKIETYGFVIH